jgi:tRNA-specific 2-thiouridylase
VATGHYAGVTRDGVTGRYRLWRGRDRQKDQSDFLWPLTQEQLAGARFPLADLTKAEVRAHARRLGLVTADKPESQEICFIPDDDYRGFLRRRAEIFQPGPIVDTRGQRLGTHAGLPAYTVGQRKGLGLSTGRALHVVDLDPRTNTVTVGAPDELLRVEAKIRHNHTAAAATVRALDDGRAEVVFDSPQRAVTPGQSVVWYQGECVVGGGVISR